MKIEIMSGWKDVPHQRWRYVLLPFHWDRCVNPKTGDGWYMVSVFGFAFFFIT